MDAPGTIDVETVGGVALLRLLGEHDLATVATVREAIRGRAVADEGVVVSLMDAEFIDSSVISELFQGDELLREQGRRLVLHVATASIVRRVLDVSNLSSALPCTGSLEEASRLALAREGVS